MAKILKFCFSLNFIVLILLSSCKKTDGYLLQDGISIKDSLHLIDSILLVRDTISIIDSSKYIDTIKVTDTTHISDTIKVIDSIKVIDTIRVYDTIWVKDTITKIDTIHVIDTIKIRDTIKIQISNSAGESTTYIKLGKGKGENLTIDGAQLSLNGTKIILLKTGTYNAITIRNINASQGKPQIITNGGLIAIKEAIYFENNNNVTLSGANISSIKYGFQFIDIAFRAIKSSGTMNGITLKNLYFKNVKDYCIAGEENNGSKFSYTGFASTMTQNLKITYCKFDNAGSIVFGGYIHKETNEDSGLFKNVEISYNDFSNTSCGSLAVFNNVEDYNIHHNVINNINTSNDNHNGIFFMQGNGEFHDNKLTNYQGNAIRAWLYSRGNTPSNVAIYNNICYNTRKYGGFELQEFSTSIISGKTTYANAIVYNNTVGQMNTSKQWDAQLVDVYQLTGTLSYYNNLGFDLYTTDPVYHPITDMIHNMGNNKIIRDENNKYFPTAFEAVYDTQNFKSRFPGIGATL
ncbi:hypothetical protein SAMN05216436_11873 [bacterium A37T11]|nr:hypothetical protein SAMN05216436_11873 [bacterium A37T11]